MVNPGDVPINNSLGIDSDESLSSAGVENPEPVDIFYGVNNSLIEEVVTRAEFDLGINLFDIMTRHIDISIQSFDKIPPHRCSIIINQNDSFYDA